MLVIVILITGCSSNNLVKRSDHSDLPSEAMGRAMSYSVYTPPGWSPLESLPMLVLLHGAGDNHESFDRWNAGAILDEAINAGRSPRVIIVFPEGELGFWENWHDGSNRYRDWVVKDLIPHISKRYVTKPCPEHCYISGISMGGHGAMRFAYYEKDTFSSASVVSAPIISKLHPGKSTIGAALLKLFIPRERIWGDVDGDSSHVPTDLDPYISWVNKQHLVELPLLLAWGSDDHESIVAGNNRFRQHLDSHGKKHSWFVYDGAHKWVYWREILSDILRFHVEAHSESANTFAPTASTKNLSYSDAETDL